SHAVHGFDWGMGVKRIMIDCVECFRNRRRARRRFLFASNESCLMRGCLEPFPMLVGIKGVFRRIVPFHSQSVPAFDCCPRVFSNNGDAARQMNDRAYPMNGTSFFLLHSPRLRAKKWRPFE